MKRSDAVHTEASVAEGAEYCETPAPGYQDDRTAPLLNEVAEATAREPAPSAVPVLRSARLIAVDGQHASIAWRESEQPIDALIAGEIERELLDEAIATRQRVLVETIPGEMPLVVGLLQTRAPRELKLDAERIELGAKQEILLRTGRAAIRLRKDGEIEIVGTRISALSRGLFRLVGRVLRLN